MSKVIGSDREYLETQYADFWKDQTHKYGINAWEQKIIDVILESGPKVCFEVGIGTGYPIATTLLEKGVETDGCDLAESSVKEACTRLGREYGRQIFTGDLMEIDIKNSYDAVYCVRSSWYMETDHFLEVLDKMIGIAKSGGTIVFDYMDSAYKHFFIWGIIKGRIISFPGKVYNLIFRHKKMFFFREKYHKREAIDDLLKMRDVEVVQTLREMDVLGPESDIKTAKVMYVVRKR